MCQKSRGRDRDYLFELWELPCQTKGVPHLKDIRSSCGAFIYLFQLCVNNPTAIHLLSTRVCQAAGWTGAEAKAF